eukprot:m.194868 g.194868  ORF g.194868 m.194868 type:complete len:370 (+) comp19312_c0_seq1:480-1589(+)
MHTSTSAPTAWWMEPTAGALAGIVETAIMHPVDTLRARLDMGAAAGSAARSEGSAQALYRMATQTLATEGIRGLYGGYGVVMLCTGPASAAYFTVYKASGRLLSDHAPNMPLPQAPVAGLMAESIALAVYTPLDVAKQRLQVSPAGTSTTSMFRGLVRERGIRGLWSGYAAGLVVWGPYSATFFGVYEMVRAAALASRTPVAACSSSHGNTTLESPHSDLHAPTPAPSPLSAPPAASPAIDFIAGCLGGTAGAVVTQPLDCVKTRVQVGAQPMSSVLDAGRSTTHTINPSAPPASVVTEAVVQPQTHRGFVATLRHILAHEGPTALMRGTVARALWLAPGAGITVSLFEAVQRLLVDAVAHGDTPPRLS